MLLRFYGQAALLCALAAAAMVGATCVDDPDGALTAHGGCPAVLGFGCSFDLSAVGGLAPPGTLVELLCPLSCDKCITPAPAPPPTKYVKSSTIDANPCSADGSSYCCDCSCLYCGPQDYCDNYSSVPF